MSIPSQLADEVLAEKLCSLGLTDRDEVAEWLAEQGLEFRTEWVLALLRQPTESEYLKDQLTLDPTIHASGGQAHIQFGTWRAQPVAVKRIENLNRDGTRRARPPEEVRAVLALHATGSACRHNVVEYLHHGFWDATDKDRGTWAVVMPAALLTLGKLLQPEGPTGQRRRLSDCETRSLMLILARVLECCQTCNLIHRDVKPANILLYPASERPEAPADSIWEFDGAVYVPVLTDFGIACAQSETITRGMQGTNNYMPPEQRHPGYHTCHVDHYALGVLAFECVTGEIPFPMENARDVVAAETALRRDPPSILALLAGRVVDDRLERIVRKLLKKKPEKRYETAALLVKDLEAFRVGEPVLAAPLGPEQDEEDLLDGDPRYANERTQLRTNEEVQRLRADAGRRNTSLAIVSGALVAMLLVILAVTVYFWYQAASEARFTEATGGTEVVMQASEYLRRLEGSAEAGIALAHRIRTFRGEDPDLDRAMRFGWAQARSALLPLLSIHEVQGNLRGCVISPDGRLVAIGSVRNRVHFFDLEGDRPLGEYTTGAQKDHDAVASLAISPNGKILAAATAGGAIHFIDTATLGPATGRPRIQHPSGIQTVAFSPDGGQVVVAGRRKLAAGNPNLAEGPPLALYDAVTGKSRRAGFLPSLLTRWPAHPVRVARRQRPCGADAEPGRGQRGGSARRHRG